MCFVILCSGPRVREQEAAWMRLCFMFLRSFKYRRDVPTSLHISTRFQCLQQVDIDQEISNWGMKVVRCTPPVLQLRKFLFPCIGDGHLRSLSGISPQTPRGGLHFRDTSRVLFSMYSKVAEEKDNKMVERWQTDSKGILIFVSLRVRIHTPIRLN